MYNLKFTLSNGIEIFPAYLNAEWRRVLKKQIGNQSEVMWCSCRTDRKLYYRISENLHFYPEHNGYEHSPLCIRYHSEENKRRTAIIRTDEETATIYLQFNPKNFTNTSVKASEDEEDDTLEEDINSSAASIIETDTEEDLSSSLELDSGDPEENEILHLDKLKVESNEYKEPRFNLATFIRCINHDTFTERVINSKPILSCDYFTNALFGRLKNLYISGIRKSVRELSLLDDGVRFFYAPFVRCDIKKSDYNISYNIVVKGNENKTYSLFTFGSIYEKALKRFHTQYGIEPNEKTMVAGFQYYPFSKRGTQYKVIGRLHLFQVSEHGLYCNSLFDQSCYNTIVSFIKDHSNYGLRFYIPTEEEELINGVLEIKGCNRKGIIILPSTKTSKEFTIDKGLFEPMLLEPDTILTERDLTEFIKRIKN